MPQLGAAGPDRPRQQPLPWVQEKLQSALQKSRSGCDRSRHHSAHRGGLELSTGTGMYGACRSTQCCLAVWSRWVDSFPVRARPLGGFRALKKTPDERRPTLPK